MRMNRLLTKYFPWSLAALGTLSSACSARSTDGPAEQSQQASTTDGVLRPPSKLGASPSPNGGALPSSSLPTYGGGPILSPEIVSLYWGNFSDSQKQGMQTYLQGLATFISGSTSPPAQEPAIWQYGVRGATVGASYSDNHLPSGDAGVGHARRDDVATEIADLQSRGLLPAYGPERLIVVFTNGITFDDDYGNSWCAQHFATGPGKYYALVPVPGTGCAPDGWGSVDPTGVWQGVASHEIFEAATDPTAYVASAGKPGWTGEIGDPCSWGSNLITMPFGTVQNVADKLQSTCSIWTTQQRPQIAGVVRPGNASAVDLFALASDHSIVHQGAATGNLSTWDQLGGTFTSPPVAIAGATGTKSLHVFAQGTDSAFYYKVWTGTAWTPYVALNNAGAHNTFNGQPAVVSWGPNRIDVFGEGIDGAYYHNAFTGNWQGWELVGGTFNGPPVAVSRGAGSLDLFGRGIDGGYYHKSYDGYSWSPSGPTQWERVGSGGPYTFISEPVVAASSDGLDVVGQGTDWNYYHLGFRGSAWSTVSSLGGSYAFIGQPAVAWQSGDLLDVVGQGSDGAYYWMHRANGQWAPLRALNGSGFGAGTLTPAPSAGALDLFIDGTDHNAYLSTLSAGSSAWSRVASGSPLH